MLHLASLASFDISEGKLQVYDDSTGIKMSYSLILNLHVEVNEAVCSDSVGMHQPEIPDKEEELQELWHGDSQPL